MLRCYAVVAIVFVAAISIRQVDYMLYSMGPLLLARYPYTLLGLKNTLHHLELPVAGNALRAC